MRTRFRAIGSLLALVLGLWACGDGSTPPGSAPVDPDRAAYRESGPWAVGVTTVAWGEREIEFWYPVAPSDAAGRVRDAYYIRDWLPDVIDALLPADANPPFVTNAYRNAPASTEGPFPLVVFAHGAASFRMQSTFLTTHLASWGFVVVSPDYLERGLGNALGQAPNEPLEDTVVTRGAVDVAKAENTRSGGLLEGVITAARIAITGHSAGGTSSIRFGHEPDVVTYLPLAAGIFGDDVLLPEHPSMWLTGDIDAVVEVDRVVAAFEQAPSPARLVRVANAGHLAQSDLCAIGRDGGGIVQIALDAGLPVPPNLQRLGTDGCQPGALAPEAGWPVFNHFVTAQLRWAFGIDSEPVGLSAAVGADFPDADFTYEER